MQPPATISPNLSPASLLIFASEVALLGLYGVSGL